MQILVPLSRRSHKPSRCAAKRWSRKISNKIPDYFSMARFPFARPKDPDSTPQINGGRNFGGSFWRFLCRSVGAGIWNVNTLIYASGPDE